MHIGLNSAPRFDRGAQQILKDLRTREALLPDGSRLGTVLLVVLGFRIAV